MVLLLSLLMVAIQQTEYDCFGLAVFVFVTWKIQVHLIPAGQHG